MCLKHRTQVLLFMIGLVYLMVLLGCNEAPFEPKDDDPVLKDYPVYFCDPTGDPQLFTFHPLTQELDSVNIPWVARYGLTVSANGERLYIATLSSVVVISAESQGFIAELPYVPRSSVAVSPNGEYLAITGDDIHILRTSDFSVVFSDTSYTKYGQFSDNSQTFYCATRASSSSPNVVYRVDLSDPAYPTQTIPISSRMVGYVIPSPDESKLYLYSGLDAVSIFDVYDVDRDSITFTDTIRPGYGQLVRSPDGSKLFYSNPGGGINFFPPTGFMVFDVNTNEIDTVENDSMYCCSTWAAPPNVMTVTADNRWLSILGGSSGALMVLYLYDIENEELLMREDFGGPGYHIFSGLSTQFNRMVDK